MVAAWVTDTNTYVWRLTVLIVMQLNLLEIKVAFKLVFTQWFGECR